MPFDRIAISRACVENNLNVIQPTWLDSAKIARRTWEQFAYKGYGLANIADHLGIKFRHHDALEDAIVAAKIVHHACEQTSLTIEDWLIRVGQPIFTYQGGLTTIKLDGNPEEPHLWRELGIYRDFIPNKKRCRSTCCGTWLQRDKFSF